MKFGDIELTLYEPNLTSYQREILYNDKRFTVTEASTKVGKTFSHIWWIFERAHLSWNREGYNHWWVAPVYRQSKIAYLRLRRKVINLTGYTVSDGNLTITTPLGSIIHFMSAKDPDSLFGDDVHSIVFDEAPRAKVEAHYALRSTITATKGVYKLIGNFGGISNWVHQLKEKALEGDSEYAYYKITAWDAVREGILTEEEIKQAQKDLPAKIFAQLYLAEETESEDMLCTYDAINDLWTNDFIEYGPLAITSDIALHGSDLFVIAVWEGMRIVHWKEIEKCDAEQVLNIITDLANEWNVPRSRVVYDADGLGSFLRGFMKGAKPFVNNASPIGDENYANLKAECGFKLAEVINSGEMYIDCDVDKKDLITELECLRSNGVDEEGKLKLLPKKKIREIIGHSPDRLDVLIMRMLLEIAPRRHVKLHIN